MFRHTQFTRMHHLAVLSRPAGTATKPRTPALRLFRSLSHATPWIRDAAGAKGKEDAVDARVGSVLSHRYHLVVCNSSQSEWLAKVEGMSETISCLARGSVRLPGRAMVTLSDFSPLKSTSSGCCGCSSAQAQPGSSNKYDKIDVAVFPLGIVAKQLDVGGVHKLLEWLGHEVLPTSWSASNTQLPRPPFEHSWLELTRNRHIFICTHGSRDQMCGTHGTKLLNDLRSLIAERNLGKHYAAWSTSHVGGHKYAANAIVYPRGDWYGTWCEKCGGSSNHSAHDAQSILDAVTRDVVWWDAWRGAINMSKTQQISAWKKGKGASASDTDTEAPDSDPAVAWTPIVRKRS